MKIDVYGRFQLEVLHENGRWVAYQLEPGKKIKLRELIFPEDLRPEEVPTYLDDFYHEMARPGQNIRIVSEDKNKKGSNA